MTLSRLYNTSVVFDLFCIDFQSNEHQNYEKNISNLETDNPSSSIKIEILFFVVFNIENKFFY